MRRVKSPKSAPGADTDSSSRSTQTRRSELSREPAYGSGIRSFVPLRVLCPLTHRVWCVSVYRDRLDCAYAINLNPSAARIEQPVFPLIALGPGVENRQINNVEDTGFGSILVLSLEF